MTNCKKTILFGFMLAIAGAVFAQCGLYIMAWVFGLLAFFTIVVAPILEDV